MEMRSGMLGGPSLPDSRVKAAWTQQAYKESDSQVGALLVQRAFCRAYAVATCRRQIVQHVLWVIMIVTTVTPGNSTVHVWSWQRLLIIDKHNDW